MKRAAEEKYLAKRIHDWHAFFNHRSGSDCPCDVQVNRFRKSQRVGGGCKPTCSCKFEKNYDVIKPSLQRQLDRGDCD